MMYNRLPPRSGSKSPTIGAREHHRAKKGKHDAATSELTPYSASNRGSPPNAPRALVALAGLPGSGKSTLAVRLAAEVNAAAGPNAMVALGMDGFHLPKAALRRTPDPEAAFARRGAPWTFDAPALVARLRELKDAAGAGAGRLARL